MEPGYKLCLHQRDFSIGKSITENIVESMSKSKGCLIILSDDYLKSNWCNFEAQVAQSIMGDKITMIILDPQVLNTTCKLTTIIKTLIKTRTYITWDAKDTKFWRRIGNAMARTESMIDTVTYTLWFIWLPATQNKVINVMKVYSKPDDEWYIISYFTYSSVGDSLFPLTEGCSLFSEGSSFLTDSLLGVGDVGAFTAGCTFEWMSLRIA